MKDKDSGEELENIDNNEVPTVKDSCDRHFIKTGKLKKPTISQESDGDVESKK